MITYHKIQSLYKRDPATKFKTFLLGEYSMPEFEYLKDVQWHGTEKVDGTNVRIGWEKGKLVIGGRTDKTQMPLDLISAIQDMFDSDAARQYFKQYPNAVLFGEGYGPGIQKVGGLYREEGKSFVLFDVWTGGRWLAAGYVEDVAHQIGLRVSPCVFDGNLIQAVEMVSRGFASTWNENLTAEGLVLRPAIELCTPDGSRIIAKLKCRDFPNV